MAAGAATVFAVVALLVVSADPVPGDRAGAEAVSALFGTRADAPMRWIGTTGTAWILAPLAVALAAWAIVRRTWGVLAVTVGTAALVWLVNPALKRLFSRERPDVRDFGESTSRWSFPAGHAVASAGFATLLVLLAWPTRARWPVTAGAITYVGLVGLSRLVLGVHHPTDLLAGWALAVAVGSGLAAWVLVPDRAPGPDSTP